MALLLDEPGKLDFRLRPHSQGSPCDAKIPPVDRNSSKVPDVWRPICGDFQMLDSINNSVILGSRNTTIEMLADYIPALVQLDRPVVDETGLNGKFDYELNFTTPCRVPKEQCGDTELDLKLKPNMAPIQTLVIDHVDQPSPS
jgi:bla regulator protein BlaR1